MSELITANLVAKKYKAGPTVNKSKPLLTLSATKRKVILDYIASDWRELIKLSFEAEGEILQNGQVRKWKPLTEKHLRTKEINNFDTDILSMSYPTLATRYQRSISIDEKNFNISLAYPKLVTGNPGGGNVFADIHQFSNAERGRPRRRIAKASFLTVARNRTIQGLTEATPEIVREISRLEIYLSFQSKLKK